MRWRSWDRLPSFMKNRKVAPYYEILSRKRGSLLGKRAFDIVGSLLLILLLLLPIVVISIWVKADSSGPVLFRQERVTQYGKTFRIYKFRTMVVDAEKLGAQVTGKEDPRITRIGKKLRKARLDELPQLFNIVAGDMSFVGTRPEVPRYVEKYTEEMYATLLLPAGVTSLASIRFKDEDEMMEGSTDPDNTYLTKVLPLKMEYNYESLREFGFWKDFAMLFKTLRAVL
jgi:lipopolysaccharide/colanic/teichoic acid biosynthesis glycosyltransferase